MDEPSFEETPGDGTATIVRPERQTDRDGGRPGIPRYHVILWNTEDHTFEYVEQMLRELFGHTHEQCVVIARTVDAEGRAVVITTTKEHAELKRDQILAYGKDDDVKNCAGSMTATIESAG